MIVKTARHELGQVRGKVIGLGIYSVIGTLAIVAQAYFFASLVNRTFLQGEPLQDVWQTVLWLAVAVIVRLGATYRQEQTAGDLAVAVKQSLHQKIVAHLFRLGVTGGSRQGDTVHLLTDGLENIEAYVARYIPQMMYSVLIPIIMAIAITDAAPWGALILLVTVPLIPVFMILIGRKAEALNKAQWSRMSFLSGHFLDVLQGMTTLKIFGRSEEQVDVVARLSAEFRDSTLKVLRIAFLSALVLELVGTISTALIAVYMGVALLYGEINFLPAFFVLLLAPEFYAPLRELGAAFHTGMAGRVALEKTDEFLALPVAEPESGIVDAPANPSTVIFTDVTYRYAGEMKDHPAVSDVTFTLERGQVTMLVGESGAGKSTIANLLLRLLGPQSGSVTVDGVDLATMDRDSWLARITYVPQHPYLFRGSVYDNITLGRAVSDEAVAEAITAAEADEFIGQLPNGWHTEIAEGGRGLSGGQRQRIALARAFLQETPILVLDEVSAHLDVATERSLNRALQRLMKDKIVLLIGHRLESMRLADTLLVMRGGHIVERGHYDELLAQDGYFRQLVAAGLGVATKDLGDAELRKSDTTSDRHAGDDEAGSEVAPSIKAVSAFNGASATTDSTVTSGSSKRAATGTATSAQSALTSTADTTMPEPSWRRLWHVLGPAKGSLWLSLLFSFLTVFMNVALLTTSAWLIATAALQPPLVALSIAIVGVRFFGISRAVCRYIERYVSHHMAFQGLYGLRVWFYSRLEPLVPAIFHRWASGDILGRIMADIETLQFFYLRVLIPPVAAIVITIIGAVFLHTLHPLLSVVIVAAFVIGAIAIPYFVYRFNRRATASVLQSRGTIKEALVETMAGLVDTITSGREEAVVKRLAQQFGGLTDGQAVIHKGNNLGRCGFIALTQITMIIGALIMIPATHGQREAGVYIAVAAIALQSYFEALGPLIVTWHHGMESRQALQRLEQLAEAKPAIVDVPVTEADKRKLEANEAANTVGTALEIAFKDVSFSYGSHRVYKDLSFTIAPGERIAVVGPSGSGKTTLTALLERFYDYRGAITVGGTELKTVPAVVAREQFGLLTQDSYLFAATLEDNIRMAKPKATDAEIDEALEKARLTEWVATLPDGKKTMIGSGGHGVSGGQGRRIALARLFLRNSPVVLLDEPLEGLDAVTRNEVQLAMENLMDGKTVIHITHHLVGLERMDRIFFMEDGAIREAGSYDELMTKEGAFYAYRKLAMEAL